MKSEQTRSELLAEHRAVETEEVDRAYRQSAMTSLPSYLIPTLTAPSSSEPSESPLEEALRLTTGDRQNSYGHPTEDFSRTAGMWNSLLSLQRRPITPEEVGMMMVLLKLSRQQNKPKRDNLVDAAGYINCVNMIVEAKQA